MEVCSNCGNFTNSLVSSTGWCGDCSLIPTQTCIRCGRYTTSNFCRTCRATNWLEVHADDIEIFMAVGLTTQAAIKAVSNRLEDACIICGDTFKARPQSEVIICTARQRCRSGKRYYKYLVYEKLMSKDEAIVLVKEKYVERGSNDTVVAA